MGGGWVGGNTTILDCLTPASQYDFRAGKLSLRYGVSLDMYVFSRTCSINFRPSHPLLYVCACV